MVVTAWCRACGLDLGPEKATVCSSCGVPLDRPEAGSARIGQVIEVKGRLGKRNGLVLNESPAGLRVLVKGDEPVDLPVEQFDAARPVDVGGPAVIGAAGRLWRAVQQCAAGSLRGKWSPEVAWAAAMPHAMASLGSRRAAAIDAIMLDQARLLPEFQLSPAEVRWYLARAAAVSGQTASLLGYLEQLPAAAYAERVRLLMMRAGDLLADPALAQRARERLEPFSERDLDARALGAALAPAPGQAALDVLMPFAAAAPGAAAGAQDQIASAIVKLERCDLPVPADLRQVRGLVTYLRGQGGQATGIDTESLSFLPVPLLDDLIDRRVIASSLAGQIRWNPEAAAYLRCRLDPGRATDAEVAGAGFMAEAARRLFLTGERPAALDDLPAGDLAVEHYRALAAWRESGTAADFDHLRPDARRVLTLVDSLRAEIKAGQVAEVPDELAADPSCWPHLRECAMTGRLELPARLREQHPRFGEWLDLCLLQQLVFEKNWVKAVSAGRDLAARTGSEATSDEALNVVAFAEHQQGQWQPLRTLDEALQGQYTTSLLVNASVLAGSQGSLAAIPYLARLVSEDTDENVRRSAIRRAVDLWGDDSSSPEYPDSLRELVRQALARPQPDDFHRWLIQQADSYDATWLVSTASPTGPARKASTVLCTSQAQTDALDYYRTWARSKSDSDDTGLADVAKVIVRLAGAAEPQAWLLAEKDEFVSQLNEAIHCPFGEALGLVPAIEVLLAGKVLELPRFLVFAAQAGAHVSCYLEEHDGSIAPEVEKRLLFDTAVRLRASKAVLSPEELEYASGEVARCFAVSANALGLITEGQFERRSEEWDELVRRERYDTQNLRAIRRQKQAVLDDLGSYVARLQTFLTYLRELPLNDASRELQAQLTKSTSGWADEIARLRKFI